MRKVFIEIIPSVKSLRQQFGTTAVIRDEDATFFLINYTELEDWLTDNIPLYMSNRKRARWSISYSRVHFAKPADALLFRLAWHGMEIATS